MATRARIRLSGSMVSISRFSGASRSTLLKITRRADTLARKFLRQFPLSITIPWFSSPFFCTLFVLRQHLKGLPLKAPSASPGRTSAQPWTQTRATALTPCTTTTEKAASTSPTGSAHKLSAWLPDTQPLDTRRPARSSTTWRAEKEAPKSRLQMEPRRRSSGQPVTRLQFPRGRRCSTPARLTPMRICLRLMIGRWWSPLVSSESRLSGKGIYET